MPRRAVKELETHELEKEPRDRRRGQHRGLATAVALRRRGIEAAVFERATTARDVGGGLIIRVNGMRALADLGLASLMPRVTPALAWRGDDCVR